jgi:hypothetical protein
MVPGGEWAPTIDAIPGAEFESQEERPAENRQTAGR